MAQTIESGGAPPVPNAGRYRWLIVGLLFLATAINYVDRQMIGVLKPTLQQEMEIGRAHVCTPVTNAHLVCRLLLVKKTKYYVPHNPTYQTQTIDYNTGTS